jgi:hypothetical protein
MSLIWPIMLGVGILVLEGYRSDRHAASVVE